MEVEIDRTVIGSVTTGTNRFTRPAHRVSTNRTTTAPPRHD
jgi:hypothetical protein